jgi:hypothetical protein
MYLVLQNWGFLGCKDYFCMSSWTCMKAFKATFRKAFSKDQLFAQNYFIFLNCMYLGGTRWKLSTNKVHASIKSGLLAFASRGPLSPWFWEVSASSLVVLSKTQNKLLWPRSLTALLTLERIPPGWLCWKYLSRSRTSYESLAERATSPGDRKKSIGFTKGF